MARKSYWTWRIGTIAGIPIRIHLTLFLLLAWIAVAHARSGSGWSMTAIGVVLVAAIFCTIVVHELGHALVARRFGVNTRDILLLPIGGIASLERMPEKPAQELAVAAVGPAINLAIAALLWLGITLAHGSTRLGEASTIGGAFAAQLMYINVALAVFNLLPAFPMDGGRILRALLALRVDRRRATDIAAAFGKLFAVAFAVLGLFANPFLLLIALVVWFGADQERMLVHIESALAGVPVTAAMARRFQAVSPTQPVGDAAAALVDAGTDQLPVLDHGHPVGVLTRRDIATAIARNGAASPVAAAPRHAYIALEPDEPLVNAFARMRDAPGALAVVVAHGTAIGTLTVDQLARYAELHGA